jgi:hypothetical protein
MRETRSEKSKAVLKKLQTAKVKETEKLPPGAEEALKEMASLATELIKDRNAQMRKLQSGKATTRVKTSEVARLPRDCSRYNTWWNAFKWLIGICDDWHECMYGCD